jgi:voltage-gated potassium channel
MLATATSNQNTYGSLAVDLDRNDEEDDDQEQATTRPLLPPPLPRHRRREMAMRRQGQQSSVLDKLFSDGKKTHSKRSVRNRTNQGSALPPASSTIFSNSKASQDDTVLPERRKHQQHRHSFVYTLLNPHSKRIQAVAYKRFISVVILVDLLFFITSTDEHIMAKHKDFFHFSEGVSSTIFLIEYFCRLVIITESKRYKAAGPLFGRLQYLRSWPALIDLFATLPFFLEYPTGWNLPTLTYLRFFRLFRILKTEGYIRAMDAIYRVVYYNSEILYVAALLCIFLILVTAVLLYYLRPANKEDAEDFGSIAATFYMSTLMLTGQGGPSGELPWYTKSIVLLTSVFSVAMFAIPASMLTWGFEAEAERMAKQAHKRLLQRRSTHGSSTTSTDDYESESPDDDSTDEEYFRIIAGADEEGDGENDTPWMKEMRERFIKADGNMDGTLTLKEFFQLQASMGEDPHDITSSQTALVNASMMSRMEALESTVAANALKLDQILAVLSDSTKGRR